MECYIDRGTQYCAVFLPRGAPVACNRENTKKQRMCVVCGAPTNRAPQAFYCEKCAKRRHRDINKAYEKTHRDSILEYRRNYYQKNKEKWLQNERRISDCSAEQNVDSQSWTDKTSVLSSMPDKTPLTDFMAYINN